MLNNLSSFSTLQFFGHNYSNDNLSYLLIIGTFQIFYKTTLNTNNYTVATPVITSSFSNTEPINN